MTDHACACTDLGLRWPRTPDSSNDLDMRHADHHGAAPATPWGDNPCSDCGDTRNIRWSTPSVFWNRVCRDGDGADPGILCVVCFVKRVYAAGLAPVGFTLIPEFHWETETERRNRRQ